MRRRPRIAFLLTQDRGGPVDLCVNLAATIAASGRAEVRLFGPTPCRGAESVRHLVQPLVIGSKGDVRAIGRSRRTLLDWRPDVIHAQDRRAGLVATAVGRLPGAPPVLVHTYHGVPDDVSEPWFRSSPGSSPPSLYTRTVLTADAAVARSVRVTVVPSTSMLTFLRRRLRVPVAKLFHIDNGVSLPPADPPRGPVRKLLFVGLLVPRKGVSDLLEALGRPGTMPDGATLSVVGDGPERAALEAAVERGPLRGRVEFLGFRSDVPALLAASDALVLPSRMEQQPLVIAEAMGAGKPVVATDTGGVSEMLTAPRAPLLVAPVADVEALAGQLRDLFHHEDPAGIGSALAASARARFSVDLAAEIHMQLYDRMLGQADPR
jgi:glycosyltransferase involved in cell wall biosynthesis